MHFHAKRILRIAQCQLGRARFDVGRRNPLHPANAVAIVRDDYRHANPRGARDLTVVCRKACQGMRTLSGLDSERRAPRRNARKNAGGKPPRNNDRIGKGRCRIQRRRAWGSVHPKRKETEVKTKYTITLALALAIVPGGAYAGDFTSSPSPAILKFSSQHSA
jgi:hypothetical protein